MRNSFFSPDQLKAAREAHEALAEISAIDVFETHITSRTKISENLVYIIELIAERLHAATESMSPALRSALDVGFVSNANAWETIDRYLQCFIDRTKQQPTEMENRLIGVIALASVTARHRMERLHVVQAEQEN